MKTENFVAGPKEAARAGESLLVAAEARRRLADLEDFQAAVPLYLEARERLGDDPRVAAGLASTYSYWGGRRELNGQESSSFDELALIEAGHALDLAPDSPEPHRALAAALSRGPWCDLSRARREADRALELDPYDGENCYEKWRSFGRGPDDPAIEKAIALSPGLAGASCDFGAALAAARRLEESAFVLAKAMAANPRHTLAHYNLAMVFLRQGKLAQARVLMERAHDMHPHDPIVLRGLAFVRPDELEAIFQ